MQIHRKKAAISSTLAYLLALVLGVGFSGAQAQDAVSFLRADHLENREGATLVGTQQFSFEGNLIFFTAHLDGREGNYVLDTGAPTLLLNARKAIKPSPTSIGVAAGGTVALSDYKVESFEMAGKDLGRRWALATDLRSMESRTGKTIDGYVGYDLIRTGELRINYQSELFYLRKSTRTPQHEGRLPDHVFKITFHDHLPVITLKVNGKKLRFVIDTGSGVNLLDSRLASTPRLATGKDRKINLQGLDGNEAVYDMVELRTPDNFRATENGIVCVAMDFDHLQSDSGNTISGILGSTFLSTYTVGIDYRRRKLYLWNPADKH